MVVIAYNNTKNLHVPLCIYLLKNISLETCLVGNSCNYNYLSLKVLILNAQLLWSLPIKHIKHDSNNSFKIIWLYIAHWSKNKIASYKKYLLLLHSQIRFYYFYLFISY